eukprot:1654499-Rhodomonas_salina.3
MALCIDQEEPERSSKHDRSGGYRAGGGQHLLVDAEQLVVLCCSHPASAHPYSSLIRAQVREICPRPASRNNRHPPADA